MVEDDGLIAILSQPGIKRQPVVRGGFHGKHDLTFDVGELSEFFHHQVISHAVIADGKGFLHDLALGSDNCDFVAAFCHIDSYNEHLLSPTNKICRHSPCSYESYPASISAEKISRIRLKNGIS